jgi:uncharacterized protein YbjT (DUF2867 family)
MIAVMGASGNIGSRVTDLLLRAKQSVRVFGRSRAKVQRLGDRGAEVVIGDAMNVGNLQLLFQGVNAALVLFRTT